MTTKNSPDLQRFIAVLRRRWWIVLVVAAIIGGAVFVYSISRVKQYAATATLQFQSSSNNQALAGFSSVNQNTPDPQSNVEQAELGDVAGSTAMAVGQGLTSNQIRRMLSFAPVGASTNFVSVTATSSRPSLAALVANTYSERFVSKQASQGASYYDHALSVVSRQLSALNPAERNSSTGLSLEARAQSLGLLSALQSANVVIAQRAVKPTSPTSPKPVEDTVLAAIVGLLVGVGLVFLLEAFDRRIRDPKQLEETYQLPLLGEVPLSPQLGRPVASESAIPPLEGEAFQLLLAHLRYFNVDRELRSVLITSATPGDGKSTVTVHLAAAAARLGTRVLLIEADLRLPTIAAKMGIRPDPGLSEVLIRGAEIRDAIHSVPAASATGAEFDDSQTIDVITAGSVTPPNAAALMQSQALQGVLQYGLDHYELVLLDTPPITSVSDAFPLLAAVDGVILVGRVGRDTRDAVRRAGESLRGANAPLLGVVANCVKRSGKSSSYYYYDYAGR